MTYLRCIVITTVGLLLCSCGSTPQTRFYTLSTADGAPAAPGHAVKPVTIGNVAIPTIDDKPQLVRRVADDRIDLLPFDRWASPLDDNMRRVFIIDLDRALPPGTVIRSNGSPYDTSIGVIDLEIDRFDADPAGNVTLDVAWSLTRGNPQQTLLRNSEHITETATDSGTSAMVEAMSHAVDDLARKIAVELPSR